MNSFNRKAAQRISAISLLLAILTSPLAWYMARESAEEEAVALAMEESRRILGHFDTTRGDVSELPRRAEAAARAITGGLFDIAEIYGADGKKLAETMTPAGEHIERLLPKHGRPNYVNATYQSVRLADERWVLRIFVPLRQENATPDALPAAYFEGVRIVPEWQQEQMRNNAFLMALIVGLAALLCGLAIYPVVVRLSAENVRKAREVLESHISMTEALGRAIARRDSDTGAHNYRVAWIAACIGEALGLQRRSMQALIVGSFLHDVGKIGISDTILLKPGRLDEAEMAIMRTHVDQGEAIVQGIEWLAEAALVVSGHHEKWDGSGYPRGLAGSAIPLGARIFAVADVFDALCSKRPYKAALSFEAAMAIILRDAGSHFDPAVVMCFQSLARSVHNQLADCSEEDCHRLLESKIRRHFAL